MRLPEPFAERMRRELGAEEAERLFVALNDEPSVAVRLNPRKAMAEKWGGRGVPWSRDGYVLAERPSFTLDPDFHAGAYYVQEAASQFAGYILAEAAGGAEACRGMRVLDMCAAPADNARKWGAGNMVVACNDSARVAAFEEWFDAVAVDAPCSGEGMFRKSEEACAQWSEAGVAMCAERQTEILRNAFRALRAGGILIYSTCTFNRTEDEEVLRRACAEFGDELCAAPPVAVDPSWGVVTGEEGVFRTFRFFPHRVSGEGMFLAVARKSGEPSRRREPKARRQAMTPVAKADARELSRWVRDGERMRFYEAGENLYGCYAERYDDVAALAGTLSVVYSGVAMGRVFKGLLKPDGALALFADLDLSAAECRDADYPTALRFLRKQDIDASGLAEGVNIVTFGGRPLGFAKRIGGRVNNMYPNSLRILK